MNDTLQNRNKRDYDLALDLGKLLDEHRGVNVVVMDMRPLDFWTDFFIVATVTSYTHLSGMERHIKDFAGERGLEILRRSRKSETGHGPAAYQSGEWQIIDMGSIVIHLMTSEARSFFELERLWNAAPLIYQGQEEGVHGTVLTGAS